MTDLPDGWRRAPLGDLCRVVSGATPKTGVPEYWRGDVAWLTPADMSADRSQVLHGGSRTLTRAGYDSCSAQLVPTGSVVVSSRAPVGYVAIAGSELATNQGCKSAVPPDYIDSHYLYWYLVAARPDLEARASGTTFREISAKEFARTTFRWPPLEEQRRIVEILEDHLSRLDAADDYLDAASRRIGQLVHSEERTLIAASAAGRASFDEVFRPVSDEGRRVAQSDYLAEGPVPVIDQGEGLVGGFTSVGHAFDGELPVIVFGDHTRRAKYVDFRFAVGAQGVKLLRAMPGVLPRFAYYLVRGANLRSRGYGRHYAMLRASSFVLPPPERQAEVVAELDSMVATTDALEQHVSVLRRRNWALRRTLLAAAFSGRLTGRASDLDLAEELVS